MEAQTIISLSLSNPHASSIAVPSVQQQQLAVDEDTIRYELERPAGDSDLRRAGILCVAWALVTGRTCNTEHVIFPVSFTENATPGAATHTNARETPRTTTAGLNFKLDGPCKVSESVAIAEKDITEILSSGHSERDLDRFYPDHQIAGAFRSHLLFETNAVVHDVRQDGGDNRERFLGACSVSLTLRLDLDRVTVVARLKSSSVTKWMVQNTLERFKMVLSQLENPSGNTNLSEVEMMTPADIEQIWLWNKHAPEAIDCCVHELFEKRVQVDPSALAVCAWDGQLTYSELDDYSTQLANRLIEHGVQPNAILPLFFEKSMWAVVAMLGVLKAGGGFVLLDSSLPQRRLFAVVQQIKTQLILCSKSNQTDSSTLAPTVIIVEQSTFSDSDTHNIPTNRPHKQASASSVMYLNFTSGSTGTPKGAFISHRQFASALYHQAEQIGFTSQTRLYDFSAYSFDLSIANTFTALTSGACLCVPSEYDRKNKLAESITSLQANTITITPSAAQILGPEEVPTLRTIFFIGEAVHVRDVNRWWARLRVGNMYGPSECTPYSVINCNPFTVEEATQLGKGAGQVTWVVDPEDHTRLLPPGFIGELLLEGPLVGEGYFHEPEKTRMAFIKARPWFCRGQNDYSLYKTGDLVRYNHDGSLIYMGRKDTQVKIHGQRAELGEIEYWIQQCLPNVKRVVVEVISVNDTTSTSLLIAFIHTNHSLKDAPQASSLEKLSITADQEAKLSESLPHYMVPNLLVTIDQFPMTATGKLDRRNLRDMGSSFYTQHLLEVREQEGKQQPSSPMERELQGIWSRVLAINSESIGLEDNLLMLGGDSIAAMKVVAEAHKVGIELTVAAIFESRTLGDLARQAQRSTVIKTEMVQAFSLLSSAADKQSLVQDISSRYELDASQIEDIYPCTPLQEGLLSLSLKNPGEYVIQRTLKLPPTVRVDDFRKAWQDVVEVTPILRTAMVQWGDSSPLQLVLAKPIKWITHTGLDEYLDFDRKLSMPMGSPLSRYALVTDSMGEYRWFVWTLHHAIYDAWSLSLITDMVQRAYDGTQITSPGPEFKTFIQYIVEKDSNQTMEYWRDTLSGCECAPFPALPPSIQQPTGDGEMKHQLTQLQAHPRRVTESALIRAAWALVTGRMTNSDEVVFGVTVSGRSAPVFGINNIVGPTLATVPFYIKLDRAQKVCDYLDSIQQQGTRMIPFEQAGLHTIARACPEAHQACMFESLIIIQPREEDNAEGRLGRWKHDHQREWRNTYALVLEVEPGKGIVNATFDSRVIERWIVRGLLERLDFVMGQLDLASADQSIAEIKMMTPKDTTKVWQWNHAVPKLVDRRVHGLIQEHVRSQPDATAISAWDGEVTYEELDRTATRMAAMLLHLGDKLGKLVPLCFEKSKWTAIAMLGVLKAGRGFVLLDPSLPELRLQEMCRQIGSIVLLSSVENMDLSRGISERVIQIGPDEEYLPLPDVTLSIPLESSSSIMYAVFTSGSTGMPKGVLISHENFCSALEYQPELLGFRRDSRVLDLASYAFDGAVHNVMATFAVGGCICVPSETDRKGDLTKTIASMRPTVLNVTPTVARLLDPSRTYALKTLILLGEAVTAYDAERWLPYDIQLINAYGPAECTPISTINHISSSANEATRIGKGVGTVTWVVDPDDHNRLVPPGCVGELLLEGPLIGLGYLDDERKTKAAFVHDPRWMLEGFPGFPECHARLYKTGDLVQYNEDGSLTYVGRKDTQVKIRGRRIELGDVEYHVRECLAQEVTQVLAEVIVPEGTRDTSPILVAFIQLREQAVKTNGAKQLGERLYHIPSDVRGKLNHRLPTYMVPSVFFSVTEMPMTSTGKINRKGLQEIGRSLLHNNGLQVLDAIDPTSHGVVQDEVILDTEQPTHKLAKKIYSMLPSWRPSRKESIQENGGPRVCMALQDITLHSSGLDSVNMMALMYFISEQFQVRVEMQLLMGRETSIRSLAALIRQSQGATPRNGAVGHLLVNGSLSVSLIKEIDRYDSETAFMQARQHASGYSEAVEDDLAEHRSTQSLTIFLTGANGFLGTQVLRQVLEHHLVGRVVCLVRGDTEEIARRRTIDAAMRALWWTDDHAKKLEVWPGDLSRPHLGLSETQWESLANMDIIIHNGANVHWAKSYAALEATNVTSTIQLLQLAVMTSHIKFVYVTGGRQWNWQTENEADVAEELSAPDAIGYSQTKFVAEAVVRRVADRATSGPNPLRVVSPGRIIGTPTEGVVNADDYIWRLVAACISIGAYNAEETNSWLGVSDVASTAATVIDAALSPQVAPLTTRITEGMMWSQFWAILVELGYSLEARNRVRWLGAVREDIDARKETHPLFPLAHLLDGQIAEQHVHPEEGGPVTVPIRKVPRRLEMAVRKSVEFLAAVGFLPMPPGETNGPSLAGNSKPFGRNGL